MSKVKATLPRNSNPLCNYEGSPCSACRYIAHWSCKKPITDENLISSLWEKHPSRKELFTLRKTLHCTGFWCEAEVKAVSNPNFQQNGSIYLPEVSIRIKETMHTPSHWTLAESNRINWDRKLFCLAVDLFFIRKIFSRWFCAKTCFCKSSSNLSFPFRTIFTKQQNQFLSQFHRW